MQTPRSKLLLGAQLREDIWNRKFRCLDSFLDELSRTLLADEAGVFRVRQAGGVPEESLKRVNLFGSTPPLDLNELSAIADQLATKVPHRDLLFQRFFWLPDVIEGAQKGWIILRRFWPDKRWRRRGEEHDCFWIYVLNPHRAMMIAPMEVGEELALQKIGNLSASFIRWKKEELEQQRVVTEHLLSLETSDVGEISSQVIDQVLRPIRPEVMLETLESISSSKKKNLSTTDRVKLFRALASNCGDCKDMCKGHKPGGSLCQLSARTGEGAEAGLLPPLHYWNLRFWEDESLEPAFARSCGSIAVSGLLDAGQYLVSTWTPKSLFGAGGGRNLLRWFVGTAILELLQDAEHSQSIKSFRTGSHSLELAEKLAGLAAVLIGEGRWKPSAIRLLPFVLGLYGHAILGVPDQLELVRHLQQTLQGEAALHTLKSHYRDHFFHTIEVCLIGFVLLKSKRTRQDTIPKVLKTNPSFADDILQWCRGRGGISLPTTERDFLAQWWVASLIHDTAYSIDALHGTLKLLEFFDDCPEILGLCRNVRNDIARASSEQVRKCDGILEELIGDSSLRKGDHGLIAASHVYSLLIKGGTGRAKSYAPAIRASAFHNSKFPRIDAGRDPVAALLALCDSIQDWGRSQHGFSSKPEVLLSRMIDEAEVPAAEQFGNVESFGFSLVLGTDGRSLVWEDPSVLTIQQKFRPHSIRNLSVFYKWADVAAGLQRVDFSGWEGANVVLVYKTPFAPHGLGRRNTPDSVFKLICAFDRDVVGRFFANFIYNAVSGKNEASVRHDESQGFDIITFDLRLLGENFLKGHPAFSGDFGEFATRLVSWRRYKDACNCCEP